MTFPRPEPAAVERAAGAGASGMEARAERAIVIAVLAVRVTFVVQLVLAIADGAPRVARPGPFVGLGVAMALESALLAVFLWRSRVVTRTAALVDLAFIAGMILAEPLYSLPSQRVGTWVAWGFGAGAAGAIVTGVGLRRLRHVAAGGLATVAAYLAVSLPAGLGTGTGWTALTNSIALIGFALGSWMTARFIRDLADAADTARAEAAELARRAAVDRQRLLLHDQATLLTLLGRPGLAGEVESVLREQAVLGSRQIRAFLAREDVPDGSGIDAEDGVSLAGLLRSVGEEFADLPLTVNVDLIVGIRVDGAAGQALAGAVRTLLHNVRRHARARAVTVHADRIDDGFFEITVQDDGVGFDPARASGFGLRVQAGSALRDAGMSVVVDSAPGDGTTVTIVGQPRGTDA